MQIGIDSFIATHEDAVTGAKSCSAERLRQFLEEVELADQSGVDVFGVGEHHRAEFLDSAPPVILAAAAARTRKIRLTSAVTVLSAADPVRVFQEFATLDLISEGRAEMVVGPWLLYGGFFRSSAWRCGTTIRSLRKSWICCSRFAMGCKLPGPGRHRPSLRGQAVYPRPWQATLPIWLGVGGTPESFARAGTLGLPLMVAIIGGQPRRFRPLIDLYREAGKLAGHAAERLKVGVHMLGYVADTAKQAADDFYPGYARMFTQIGLERGWPPVRRAHYDELLGPEGALLIGEPAAVAEKILHFDQVLGGLDRVSLQMSPGTLPHAQALHGIELLGTKVAPVIAGAKSG